MVIEQTQLSMHHPHYTIRPVNSSQWLCFSLFQCYETNFLQRLQAQNLQTCNVSGVKHSTDSTLTWQIRQVGGVVFFILSSWTYFLYRLYSVHSTAASAFRYFLDDVDSLNSKARTVRWLAGGDCASGRPFSKPHQSFSSHKRWQAERQHGSFVGAARIANRYPDLSLASTRQ